MLMCKYTHTRIHQTTKLHSSFNRRAICWVFGVKMFPLFFFRVWKPTICPTIATHYQLSPHSSSGWARWCCCCCCWWWLLYVPCDSLCVTNKGIFSHQTRPLAESARCDARYVVLPFFCVAPVVAALSLSLCAVGAALLVGALMQVWRSWRTGTVPTIIPHFHPQRNTVSPQRQQQQQQQRHLAATYEEGVTRDTTSFSTSGERELHQGLRVFV